MFPPNIKSANIMLCLLVLMEKSSKKAWLVMAMQQFLRLKFPRRVESVLPDGRKILTIPR